MIECRRKYLKGVSDGIRGEHHGQVLISTVYLFVFPMFTFALIHLKLAHPELDIPWVVTFTPLMLQQFLLFIFPCFMYVCN